MEIMEDLSPTEGSKILLDAIVYDLNEYCILGGEGAVLG